MWFTERSRLVTVMEPMDPTSLVCLRLVIFATHEDVECPLEDDGDQDEIIFSPELLL